MNTRMRNTSLLTLGLTLLIISGCDQASESAQKFFDDTVEKTSEAARKAVDETVGDVVEEINNQVDVAQKGINEVLGKPEEKSEQDPGATEQATEESAEEKMNQG